jgi:hypothetical protein
MTRNRRLAWIGLVVIPLSTTGCTVLGYRIGAEFDGIGPPLPPSSLCLPADRQEARPVILQMKDGRTIEGKLVPSQCEQDSVVLVETEGPGPGNRSIFDSGEVRDMQHYPLANVAWARHRERSPMRLVLGTIGVGVDLYVSYYVISRIFPSSLGID